MSRVDVLVAAYNEADNIPRLLHSLGQQTAPRDSFRVIVVDNASTDGTPDVVAQHTGDLDVMLLHEERSGKNIALNTGLAAADAEYVATIDADIKADARWIETMLGVIGQPSPPDVFGGPYYPYYIAKQPRWYKDAYNTHSLGQEARRIRPNEYLSGGNMVLRREVVARLGGFHTAIGPVGRGAARGGETNLLIRARRELPGVDIRYYPDLVVYHLTRPHTASLGYWAKRNYLTGRRSLTIWGHPEERPSGLQIAVGLLRATGGIVLDATLGMLTRDRKQYPYPANYYYEHTIPKLSGVGRLVAHWEEA